MRPVTKSDRVYGLDILRAFAILFVIYSHSFFLIVDHINEKAYNFFSFDGVTLFFVLSGFLIGGILIRTIHTTSFSFNDLLNFWIRRWFRTLPNYFFMLLLLILLTVLMNRELPDMLARYFFFFQNFNSPHPSFFPEAWSLSIEEWFYLLVPIGLFISLHALPQHRSQVILTWILSIIVVVTAYRFYRSIHFGYHDFEAWDNNQRKLVLTRLDSIMFGFLGAWTRFFYREKWLGLKKILLLPGFILLFIPQIVHTTRADDSFFNNYLSLTITSAGTLFLLPALSELKSGKGPVYRFLTFVSIISYSMYLVNFSLVQLSIIPSLTSTIVVFTRNHLAISIIRYVLYWGFTFGLSYLLYRYFEKPVMQLREKFKGKKVVVRQ